TSSPTIASYQSDPANPIANAAAARNAYVVKIQLPSLKRIVRLWKSSVQRLNQDPGRGIVSTSASGAVRGVFDMRLPVGGAHGSQNLRGRQTTGNPARVCSRNRASKGGLAAVLVGPVTYPTPQFGRPRPQC